MMELAPTVEEAVKKLAEECDVFLDEVKITMHIRSRVEPKKI